jgi:hypothetical protein
VALCFLFAFPGNIAHQDMVGLVSGLEGPTPRWGAYVERSAAGSVHQAEMPFLDNTTTGSLSGAGMERPGLGKIALLERKGAVSEVPDELRVNRAAKRGRVIKVAPVAPPRSLDASGFPISGIFRGVAAARTEEDHASISVPRPACLAEALRGDSAPVASFSSAVIRLVRSPAPHGRWGDQTLF